MFSQVGRILLHVDHLASVNEWVIWEVFRGSNVDTLISIEGFGEIITVNNAEYSFVNIEVHSESEIWPIIYYITVWLWKLVSFQEDSLRNSRVLNFWLDDVESIIIKVEVDNTFSNTVVLILVLNNWLKEVCLEVKDLQEERECKRI